MKIEIRSRFNSAVLFSLETESVKLCLQAAVKSRANLCGADLYGANLAGADLAGADLCGANLCGADLYGANLYGANLAGADLAGADLAGADLAGANLAGANLAGADLAGADLAGADLAGADLAMQLGCPNKWDAWTYINKEGVQRIRVGCRDKSIAEGQAYWADKKNRLEVLAALNYAKAIGKLRGWKQ